MTGAEPSALEPTIGGHHPDVPRDTVTRLRTWMADGLTAVTMATQNGHLWEQQAWTVHLYVAHPAFGHTAVLSVMRCGDLWVAAEDVTWRQSIRSAVD